MEGKVVVITGATSGIGQVAAGQLAGKGARMVLVARDRARGEAALARLRESAPGIAHCVHYADLSLLAEMKRVARDIAAAEARIDVLINNAGALFNTRQVTAEGLELTFAVNHMAYFVLTHCLRERLIATPGARVVNTASIAHMRFDIDFDDLQSEQDYGGINIYGKSKLCNILFTRELARRLACTGVTANCLHPGFVASRFGDESGGLMSYVVRLAKLFGTSPAKGAETLVYLASSGEVAQVSGEYFYKCRPSPTSSSARDGEAARRLWQESARLAGIDAD